jgi:hypothetical protein
VRYLTHPTTEGWELNQPLAFRLSENDGFDRRLVSVQATSLPKGGRNAPIRTIDEGQIGKFSVISSIRGMTKF